mmetsp:Transcript_89378/g.253253  ORF Transcript_89378/g.253253 Transcript_89378/m.253253 type:complete len:455 (+) Transcript_89378:199-1563(+)
MSDNEASTTIPVFMPIHLDAANPKASSSAAYSADLPSEASTALAAHDPAGVDSWSLPPPPIADAGPASPQSLEQRSKQLGRDFAKLRKTLARANADLDNANKDFDALQVTLARAKADLDNAIKNFARANEDLDNANKKLSHSCQCHMELREFHEKLRNEMWPLITNNIGSRVVQKAIEKSDVTQQKFLASGLEGHVDEAWRSGNAYHVLNKCIEVMPRTSVRFIIKEMLDKGSVVEAAKHKSGAICVVRLITYGGGTTTLLQQPTEGDPATAEDQTSHQELLTRLIHEIVSSTKELANDKYGNHVLQAVLEHTHRDFRRQIVQELKAGLAGWITNKYSSYVVQKALQYVPDPELQDLVLAILDLSHLKKTNKASFVFGCVYKTPHLRARVPPEYLNPTHRDDSPAFNGQGRGKRPQRRRRGQKGGESGAAPKSPSRGRAAAPTAAARGGLFIFI